MKTNITRILIGISALLATGLFAAQAFANAPTIQIVGTSNVQTSMANVVVNYDSGVPQVDVTNYPLVSVQYGTDQSFNLSTPPSGSQFDAEGNPTITLFGLSPATTYYIRASMTFDGQTSFSNVMSFTTKSSLFSGSNSATVQTYTGIVVPESQVPAGVTSWEKIFGGNASSNTNASVTKNGVTLSVSDGQTRVVSGDKLTVTISYQNANDYTLRDAKIGIALPPEYSFANQNDGRFAENGNTAVLNLLSIAPNESDSISFQVLASGNSSDSNAQIRADLQYDGGSVSAYDTDNYVGGANGSVLGASVFGAGFFPQTIVGWTFFVILLIIIMIVARRYLKKPEPKKPEEDQKPKTA